MKNTYLMLQPYISNNNIFYKDKDLNTPIQYKIYTLSGKDTLRFIPNGCEEIVYLFDLEETRFNILFVRGDYQDISTYGCEVLGIRLIPGYGFAEKEKLHELGEQIRSLGSFEVRTKYIHSNIKDIITNKCTNSVVENVLKEISELKGAGSVSEIYNKQKYSARHVNRLFIEEMGIGVKDYARYTRLQNALSMMIENPKSPALELLEHLDYSDQAHYQREFRQFMGMSPQKFIMRYII